MTFHTLIPPRILADVPPLGAQDGEGEGAVVHVKVFDPCGSATWWITEIDPRTGEAFGFVTGLGCDEWGSVDLNELASVRNRMGLRMERDLHFTPKPLNRCIST